MHIQHYIKEALVEQSVANYRDMEGLGGIIFWLDAVLRVVSWSTWKLKQHEITSQSAVCMNLHSLYAITEQPIDMKLSQIDGELFKCIVK